jgi:regulator of RNase E activity RraA
LRAKTWTPTLFSKIAVTHNAPIGCSELAVWPGDVIVGDREGVYVIPAHLADEMANETVEMTAFEDFVIEEVKKGRSTLGLYPATEQQSKDDYLAWRKS